MSKSFIDACLTGEAHPGDIDDWVDAWHDSQPGSEAVSLDQFLGFTESEGARWARNPSSLSRIIEGRQLAEKRA